MTNTQQRKYALIKIEKGDYLLPSNDKRTVIRLKQCEERNDRLSLDGGLIFETRTRWEIYRKPLFLLADSLTGEDVPDGFQFGEDWLDWDTWELFDTGFKSRKAAIAGCSSLIAGRQ